MGGELIIVPGNAKYRGLLLVSEKEVILMSKYNLEKKSPWLPAAPTSCASGGVNERAWPRAAELAASGGIGLSRRVHI